MYSKEFQFLLGLKLSNTSKLNLRWSSPGGCINYNPSTRTITVNCSSAWLADIDNTLHDSSLLAKQFPTGT